MLTVRAGERAEQEKRPAHPQLISGPCRFRASDGPELTCLASRRVRLDLSCGADDRRYLTPRRASCLTRLSIVLRAETYVATLVARP